MKVETFKVEGPKLITSAAHKDDRGFFVERYKENVFKEIGISNHFVQDNFSRSQPRVLRGLHFQWDKPQAKMVTCLTGQIFDVAVDIRKNSPTLGQHVAVVLSGDQPQWFYIPPGFAHGFVVLGDQGADVFYKVDQYWNGKGEAGIVWNDSDVKISWPVADPLLSPKDAVAQTFSQYLKDPKFA